MDCDIGNDDGDAARDAEMSERSGLLRTRQQRHSKPPGARALESSRELIVFTLIASLGGFLFGFDTGVISGALPYIQEDAILQGRSFVGWVWFRATQPG